MMTCYKKLRAYPVAPFPARLARHELSLLEHQRPLNRTLNPQRRHSMDPQTV